MAERWKIKGGTVLQGSLKVPAAKNAVLPIMAAALMHESVTVLENAPQLRDVQSMCVLLRHLGAQVQQKGDCLYIDAHEISGCSLPQSVSAEIRSSIFMLGPLLARKQCAVMAYPGGCEIGLRPIDLHLKGLRALGVHIEEEQGKIFCDGKDMHAGSVVLDYPSVGATENVMMAAAFLQGNSVIHNAACEPEIEDLAMFLNRIGAQITGAGSGTIYIAGAQGQRQKGPVCYQVMPDRILAGTYLAAAAATGGDITLYGAQEKHLAAVTAKLREMGCRLSCTPGAIRLQADQALRAAGRLETNPYPGFPTDMQAQMMALCCLCQGTTLLQENVFEHRFRHAAELARMGADIQVCGRTAVVRGTGKLHGATVRAHDLRAGAALVIAAMAAQGTTILEDAQLIRRGYADMAADMNQLGACIVTQT